MATGQAPFEGIYPPSTVVRAILHDKLQLSIEAQHFLQAKVWISLQWSAGMKL
jgi:hypothetical protein